jgi:hypothetical protein
LWTDAILTPVFLSVVENKNGSHWSPEALDVEVVNLGGIGKKMLP